MLRLEPLWWAWFVLRNWWGWHRVGGGSMDYCRVVGMHVPSRHFAAWVNGDAA